MAMDEGKLEYWSGHYTQWQVSGLTRQAYCEREGLILSTYERWSKRVRSRARSTNATGELSTAPTQLLTLVPVKLQGGSPRDVIVLRSDAGWEVYLPMEIDAAWLVDVLKRLP